MRLIPSALTMLQIALNSVTTDSHWNKCRLRQSRIHESEISLCIQSGSLVCDSRELHGSHWESHATRLVTYNSQ